MRKVMMQPDGAEEDTCSATVGTDVANVGVLGSGLSLPRRFERQIEAGQTIAAAQDTRDLLLLQDHDALNRFNQRICEPLLFDANQRLESGRCGRHVETLSQSYANLQ